MQFQFNKNLLFLKDVNIDSIRQYDNYYEISISKPVSSHKCPVCGTQTIKIHDYRYQRIKDIPFLNKPLHLLYRKRRYRCTECGKRFYETADFIGKYQRMTHRLIEAIIEKLRTNYSMTSIAKDFGISSSTVARIFDYISYSINELPEVISIDEFKGTTDKGKYHCILVDPVKSVVLDILDQRNFDFLVKYFKKFTNLENVKYVVIDMWKPYKEVVKKIFPQATIVIDRFHYVRNCIWAIDKFRKYTQKDLPYEKSRFLKKNRKLLLRNRRKLSDDDKIKLANLLRLDEKLRLAYVLKEKFMDFVNAANSGEAEIKLNEWLELVKRYKIEQFSYLANTISNWKEEILNSFDVPYTNGCVEGFNNKIKVIKRNGYGYRNFSRFRNRILHCCT